MLDDTVPMEAAHSGPDEAQVCQECDPPRPVTNLRQHRYRVHGPGRRPAGDRPPSPAGPRARRPKSLRADLEVTFAFAAQVAVMRDPVCGGVAMQQVPQIALAWDNWAKSSPTVHKYLSWALAGGGGVGVVIAHLPIILIIVQHHGPDRHRYFPPAPPPDPDDAVSANGHGEAPWSGPGPVSSGYVPGSADHARA
jgi:hypothetical protein